MKREESDPRVDLYIFLHSPSHCYMEGSTLYARTLKAWLFFFAFCSLFLQIILISLGPLGCLLSSLTKADFNVLSTTLSFYT